MSKVRSTVALHTGLTLRAKAEVPCAKRSRKSAEAGFSLMMTAMCLIVMIGMLGLVIDVGQMLITKSELQAYVDAAALAAASQLDGSKTGMQNAENLARSGPLGSTVPNGVQYGVSTIPTTAISTAYLSSFTGAADNYSKAYNGTPATAGADYRFVRVTASRSVTVSFIPVVSRVTQYLVSATATAGQKANVGVTGVAPFTPAAHDPTDTKNWGLTPGGEYSLKWGNGNSTNCAGDIGFDPQNDPPQHGYIDVGQGNGSSGLAQVIEYDSCPLCPLSVNQQLDGVPGNRAVVGSYLVNRTDQDPDQSSLTWAQYRTAGTGNYRRIITVPIHDPSQTSGNGGNTTYTIIGFASFLLAPASSYGNTSGSICATYIGPATTYGGASAGPSGTGSYSVVLFK